MQSQHMLCRNCVSQQRLLVKLTPIQLMHTQGPHSESIQVPMRVKLWIMLDGTAPQHLVCFLCQACSPLMKNLLKETNGNTFTADYWTLIAMFLNVLHGHGESKMIIPNTDKRSQNLRLYWSTRIYIFSDCPIDTCLFSVFYLVHVVDYSCSIYIISSLCA